MRDTAAANIIQKHFRCWFFRHSYLQLHSASVLIQSGIRGFSTRRKFLYRKEDRAATLIQVKAYILLDFFLIVCDMHGKHSSDSLAVHSILNSAYWVVTSDILILMQNVFFCFCGSSSFRSGLSACHNFFVLCKINIYALVFYF